MAETNVEAKEVQETTEVIVDEHKSVKDKFVESKPVAFVRRHAKGFVAGTAGLAAVVTAGVLAAKAAKDGALEVPFDIESATDAVSEAVDAVTE